MRLYEDRELRLYEVTSMSNVKELFTRRQFDPS